MFDEAGGRDFGDFEAWFKTIKQVQEAHEQYFTKENIPTALCVVDRSHYDFDKPKDFSRILQIIDKEIQAGQ